MTRPLGRARTAARPTPGRSTPSRPTPASSPSDLDHALAAAARVTNDAPTTFAVLGLPEPLTASLAARGLDVPFPIQARTVPDALAGRDVLGRAQTGSGKTLAFGLPLLATLARPAARRVPRIPRGLVLVPTRELARQVTDTLAPLGRAVRVRVTAVYGGAAIGRQIEAVVRADVVVATPGRLLDLIDRRACSLAEVAVTVLDEADHMADLGFLPAVTRILDQTPPDGQRLLFSATLDRGVDRLVRSYLTEPAIHAVAPGVETAESAEHHVFRLRPEDKLAVTAEVISGPGRTLLFVRTKRGADRLVTQLRRVGVEAAAIHGDLRQSARQRALDGFASGRPRVLVATDVAARGIHIDDITLVVHFDPPNDAKDYLHRSGRTARAGARGTVVALAHPDQLRGVAQLQERAGVVAATTRVHPGHDAVRRIAQTGSAAARGAA